MIIRPETRADIAAIRALVVAAFPTPDEADLVERLREDGDATISLVAEEAGDICGHVLCSPMTAPFPALGLAPLAVAPGRQRQGIGARLVRAALAEARDRDWKAVFVVGDPAYYGRFGFDARAAEGFACAYAGRHFMVTSFGRALPSATGPVAYAPAFSS